LGVEPFVVVMPEDDPLLKCSGPVPPRSLGRRAWVSHGSGTVEERLLTDAIRDAGVAIDTVARTAPPGAPRWS
jgi:DNA-binding transcriptional LysR family regulator